MDDKSEIDPEQFLRALLAVSPEDAEEVRAAATEKADMPGDDDPDVIAGMERLRQLREAEGDVPEVSP